MKLLAIDTSGDTCSAALLLDGGVEQLLETAPRQHGERILPMMQALLDGAGLRLTDLDALAFGRGPGSFTGVRIATAVIQGAAFGAGLPVVPVSTLGALAQGQFRRGGQRRLLTALDARMDEVYWGCFEIGEHDLAVVQGEERVCPPERITIPAGAGWIGEHDLAVVQGEERVCPPERITIPAGAGWYGVGPGWSAYDLTLQTQVGDALDGANPEAFCEARDIAVLAAADFAAGRHLPPELAAPIYLRDQVTR